MGRVAALYGGLWRACDGGLREHERADHRDEVVCPRGVLPVTERVDALERVEEAKVRRAICGATELGGSIMISDAGDDSLRMRLYPGVSCELRMQEEGGRAEAEPAATKQATYHFSLGTVSGKWPQLRAAQSPPRRSQE